MTDAIVVGGGLAGMAAATAIASQGLQVELYEAKPFLGGRATSYRVPGEEAHGDSEIDNCQHILLRCCVNLLDFYRRVGMEHAIEFHREFTFLEPGGRMSDLKRGLLPAPFHFSESFLKASYLTLGEKLALGRAMLAVMMERKSRRDLEDITMLQWLEEKRQPARLIERFWRQVLVSAINVELDQMAAAHGFQVMWLGFLASTETYEMGIPKIPLGQLYRAEVPGVKSYEKSSIEALDAERGVKVGGEWKQARAYVSAVPADKLAGLGTGLDVEFGAFLPSSITGIHLWFDRPVTELPHATLLDRNIQWFFNKGEGKYLMLVVSASEQFVRMGRQEVIDTAVRELAEFLPRVKEAKLERSHVVKEVKATFQARPGLEAKRPLARTKYENLFLAGDWTRSGWPATMEGAVRSGYLAAEAACDYLGRPGKFLIPDVA